MEQVPVQTDISKRRVPSHQLQKRLYAEILFYSLCAKNILKIQGLGDREHLTTWNDVVN